MAWFPGAIRKPVARFNAGGDKCVARDHDRGVCLHIAVSEGASLFNYFNQPGNPCSHFYVRYDGDVEQYVDTRYRAPANLEGNPTLISVETMGGKADPHRPWTPEQVETLAQISAWCAKVHPDIPLIRMPSSRPAATGIGYHRLGVDPWRVDGGERWSLAYGKTCPFDQNIALIPTIITRSRQIAAGEDDGAMAWTDAQIAELLANSKETTATVNELAQLFRTHSVRMDTLVNTQMAEVKQDVESIRSAVANMEIRSAYVANEALPQIVAGVGTIADDVDTLRDSNTPNPDAD